MNSDKDELPETKPEKKTSVIYFHAHTHPSRRCCRLLTHIRTHRRLPLVQILTNKLCFGILRVRVCVCLCARGMSSAVCTCAT